MFNVDQTISVLPCDLRTAQLVLVLLHHLRLRLPHAIESTMLRLVDPGRMRRTPRPAEASSDRHGLSAPPRMPPRHVSMCIHSCEEQ